MLATVELVDANSDTTDDEAHREFHTLKFVSNTCNFHHCGYLEEEGFGEGINSRLNCHAELEFICRNQLDFY
jgi:hypothetical protein